jgi:RND family efflux transporter MFP subunit
MQTVEQKKIVIKLPTLSWSSLISVRFFLILAMLLFSTGVAYWYRNVRPFLWISSAHLNAFSTTFNSDSAGRIVEMGPQEGARVKKGQPLFSLDRDKILARHAQTKFSLETLNQQIEFEKEKIGKAMEAYLAAATDVELGIGSPEKVQKQLAIMEEAQGKAESAVSKTGALKSELTALELELKKATLAAPFDGVILKRFKNEGEVLSFGDPIYTLCDTDRLWVETEIAETEIGNISLGTPARIRLAAYPKKEFKGEVSYIGPATVAKTDLLPFSEEKATVPIKISVENPDISLKPGLSAKVALKVR